MAVHESTVNFDKLIADLAGMYPDSQPEEVVLIELVANSLDARASRIAIAYEPKARTLVVEDNGNGMTNSQFREYHNLAAETKTRGTTIGFAGVGAKISFNRADRVITETRSARFSGASDWYFAAKNRLVWEDIPLRHLQGNGTYVEVHFREDSEVPYATTAELIQMLQRHYLPLLEQSFLKLYSKTDLYPEELRFIVNGEQVRPFDAIAEFALGKVEKSIPRHGKKPLGYSVFGVSEREYPIDPSLAGILLCTHGKVIKADNFGQFPSGDLGARIFGLAELPGLINFVTTSKTDFRPRPGKNRDFQRIYETIRNEYREWLTSVGVETVEEKNITEARLLERELRKLSQDIPELGEFFGFRAPRSALSANADGPIEADVHEGQESTFPDGEGTRGEGPGVVDAGDQPGEALVPAQDEGGQRAEPISRSSRGGPKISFKAVEERLELGWVEGNTVVINTGHPAYKRVEKNQAARLLHSLLAIGTAIQRHFGDQASEPDLMFVDRLLASWGAPKR